MLNTVLCLIHFHNFRQIPITVHNEWLNKTFKKDEKKMYPRFTRKSIRNTAIWISFQDRLLLNVGQREHSAILSTLIKLPFVFKTFVLSIFVSGRLRQVLLYCT